MAIQGPLRELGIHDVFQLLDLSRKTGRLTVTSALRDNEGTIDFRAGRVVSATMRVNPHSIGDVLVRSGKITAGQLADARKVQQQPDEHRSLQTILVDLGAVTMREMDRQIRRDIEVVVFEIMSWREGFFSFIEGGAESQPGDGAGLATESLLMEAARRIDEWSRIVHVVPNVGAVPVLADVSADAPPTLDLRPSEWAVLSFVDGEADCRDIAATVGLSDFEVAKIVFGLVSTGVLAVRIGSPTTSHDGLDADALMTAARLSVRQGDLPRAIACWERVVALDGATAQATQAREAMSHAARLNALVEARNAA